MGRLQHFLKPYLKKEEEEEALSQLEMELGQRACLACSG